ncbi:rhodanese-like domain-containing protein [Hyalangium rubrum]|uniref:Rhodanese-like domain-containing protein n=1 Tax=Hyalangium rubrum TaxID=3103134 RepID=A0ABU5H7J7_9BACT|nr:rhodanese-like domain-containing protein [Hyalangium sp. s54d21]MDY7229074.1 rhodanese-like domain-containing protein [Hyalangium sp. s54d21]
MHSERILSVAPAGLEDLPASVRRIDVREPSEFAGLLGRLPRTELIPLASLPAAAESWARTSPLLLICRSGARSLKAAQLLTTSGFTTLYNLEGGMLAVREAGFTVEGPSQPMHTSPGQIREALCAALRELYPSPPPYESLFTDHTSASHPNRQEFLGALERLRARAHADRLEAHAIDTHMRHLRDLVALLQEQQAWVP